MQSGNYSDPNMPLGRDEVARAIATAEQKMSRYCGFWVAPKYFCRDKINWVPPKRGYQLVVPTLQTHWGYLIEAGIEAWTLIDSDVPVVYSDDDADTVLDLATITYDTYLGITDACEVVVVPPGMDPSTAEWRIRPLDISLSAGIVTITGPRWMFVLPDEWKKIVPILMSDNTKFLSTVDLYRRHTDASQQAQYQWVPSACDAPCAPICQDACVMIMNERVGFFTAEPSTYSAVTSSWTRADWAAARVPNEVRVWYRAGYREPGCEDCDEMPEDLKQAIVSLSNVYLREGVCGCGMTQARFNHDKEEQDIDTYDVSMAKTAFGSAAWGAVFAFSVISRLPPLGKGG
jgi:hypothetical protein